MAPKDDGWVRFTYITRQTYLKKIVVMVALDDVCGNPSSISHITLDQRANKQTKQHCHPSSPAVTMTLNTP